MSKYKPYAPKIDLWKGRKPEKKKICGVYAEYGFNNGRGCPKEPGHENEPGNEKHGFWEENNE